ncbi:hypothetical protein DRQ15_08115 [candidate division KSB1 bacterium]|nr:MAG: hypothetical protein DRP98_09770 [candidate division KSB1 bacterium]RKY90119.1 MAG: hypothetical protein DRQ15_08115 [candidate division KSB1 bacterium]
MPVKKSRNEVAEISLFSQEMEKTLRELLESRERNIPTFSPTLNRNLNGGLRKGDFLTILGAPGSGKTTFLWQLAQYIAENGKEIESQRVPVPCLYLTFQMKKNDLYLWALNRLEKIDGGLLFGRRWLDMKTPEERENLLKRIVKANIQFSDIGKNLAVQDISTMRSHKSSVEDIAAYARQFLRVFRTNLETQRKEAPNAEEKEKIDFFLVHANHLVIFVDPMELIGVEQVPYWEESIFDRFISFKLKELAVHLDCTVVAARTTFAVSKKNTDKGEQEFSSVEEKVDSIPGADFVAILKSGYRLMDEKIKEFDKEKKEKKEAKKETQIIQMKQEQAGRVKSKKLLDGIGDPIYASLDIIKNRKGGTESCLFLWNRSFNEFIEVGG